MQEQTTTQPTNLPEQPTTQTPDAPPTSTVHSSIGGVVELGQGEEPPPMEWLAEGIIPEGHATILSGDGGLGKSYVAQHLALCILRGKPFFGRRVKRGTVLWIDAEGMGKDEGERRLFAVARGLGLDKPPEHFYYYRPSFSVGDDRTQAAILEAIDGLNVKFVILDSFSMGAADSDVSSQVDTVSLLRRVQEWGVTSLLLDHITKAASQGDQARATIFGSVFKRNGARSTLKLVGQDESVRELIQDKSNFGPNTGGIRYEMLFEQDDEGRKVVRFVDQGEVAPQPKEKKKRTQDITFDVLNQLSSDGSPISAEAIASERDLDVKTIRNHLSKLSGDGRIESVGDGTYNLSPGEE